MAADYQYRTNNRANGHYEFDPERFGNYHWNYVHDQPGIFESGGQVIQFLARLLTLVAASAFVGVLLGIIYDRGL